ncbi:CidA/LrgA family protein [Silvimonas amylolytica]|uniref:Murein hydrolase exporter n=1 Tax=Silvimonas amylolytica TaxID=449663 RepID=A0ABQ2PP05_9NEIS|nr:CidA/LrgA family protein [Silvimonas amylolytica]GGP27357.1 murein hydrolase exporter [Silvimonas amylolytica]
MSSSITSASYAPAAPASPWGQRVRQIANVIVQVLALSALWLLAAWMQTRWHVPMPASLLGLLLLTGLLFTGVVKTGWIRQGANWLLSEMLLFFVPAVLAVVNHPELLHSQGWRVCTVIGLSTVAVMVVTAFVVDVVYKFELKLARRRSNRHV